MHLLCIEIMQLGEKCLHHDCLRVEFVLCMLQLSFDTVYKYLSTLWRYHMF
jgi:hypothetical protein